MVLRLRDIYEDVWETEEKVDFQSTPTSSDIVWHEADFWAATPPCTYRAGRQGELASASGLHDFLAETETGFMIDTNAVLSMIYAAPWCGNTPAEYRPLKTVSGIEVGITDVDVEVEVSGALRPKKTRMTTLKIESRGRGRFGPGLLDFYVDL